MEQTDFLKGALIGGCLGGLVALLLAPKSGKELRDDISNSYSAINQQTHEYADEAKKEVQCLMDSLHGMQCDKDHAFLYGSLAGAILGALSGLLLAPQAGTRLRSRLGDSYDDIYDKAKDIVSGLKGRQHDFGDKIEEWKDVFETIVDKLSTTKTKGNQGKYFNKIMDWASLGLRLYDQMQARR